tara:strand:+ start:286 stop:600 length:315 start_codon:yes stop_codon:yes gene_type:complete
MQKITINIIDYNGKKHAICTDLGLHSNLMELLKSEGFAIGTCGGMALCASCHCYVCHIDKSNNKSEEEEDMLNQLYNSNSDSRLICQIPLKKELDGIVLTMVKD